MTTLKHNCWRRVKWVDFVFDFFFKFSLYLTLFVNKPIENSVCLKNLFAQNSYHGILFKINALISVSIFIFNAQIWGYVRISGCARSQLLFACKKAVKTHKAYLSSFIFSIFKNLLCKSLCFQYMGGKESQWHNKTLVLSFISLCKTELRISVKSLISKYPYTTLVSVSFCELSFYKQCETSFEQSAMLELKIIIIKLLFFVKYFGDCRKKQLQTTFFSKVVFL